MATFSFRPSFEITSVKTMTEVIQRVKDHLKHDIHHLEGEGMQDHITIRVRASHRHYWSPQLSVLMHDDEKENTISIRGVYGPMPNVWTLFTISYLAIGTLSLFISIIGFSQQALGQEAPVLWVLPVLAVLAIMLYLLGQMGQKLGAAQTYAIHYFFEDALGEPLPEI
jgi:hypothetical protein